MQRAAEQSELVLTTVGCVIAIADAESPAMSPELWNAPASETPWLVRARALVERGDLFLHLPLIDGTYRLLLTTNEPPNGEEGIGKQRLALPSGRVVCRSGAPTEVAMPALELSAGAYDVWLSWSTDEESKHWDIDSRERYPDGDGPDGVVYFRRSGAL